MKITKKSVGYLFIVVIIILYIIFWLIAHNDDSIPQFTKQKVALASGIAPDTHQVVTIDPFTGKEVFPCGTTDDIFISNNTSDTLQEQNKYKQKSAISRDAKNCNTQILGTDDALKLPQLKEALKSSQTPIKGMVRDNGINKPATFIVTVSAIYLGSHCETMYSAGKQRRKCIRREEECQALGIC
jgi:hypothetical protein